MNNSLQRFDRDGIEIFICELTGKSFTNLLTLAKMCNKNESTIRTFAGARNFELIDAVIHTDGGLQGARLFNENQILEVVTKYNPTLMIQFAKLGIRLTLHKMAGREIAPAPKIDPAEKAVKFADALKYFEKFGVNFDNPRFSAGIKDLILDSLGVSQHRLPAAPTLISCGVAERAEQLGYPVATISRYRSALGRFVKLQGLKPIIAENRLCNGTERPVNLYNVSDELDAAIHSYFSKKVVGV